MCRRFLVISCKRTFVLFLLICLGCSAQGPTELSQKIERQLRVKYSVTADVNVVISEPTASEFANYDAVKVTFSGQGRDQQYDFLASKDRKTLVRLPTMDRSKAPYQEVMDQIDVKGRAVRGDPSAEVMLVSFDRLECPYCSQMRGVLFPGLLKEYGDRVAFVYKDFPLAEI